MGVGLAAGGTRFGYIKVDINYGGYKSSRMWKRLIIPPNWLTSILKQLLTSVISFRLVVSLGKCHMAKVSYGESVMWGKCHMGKVSCGESGICGRCHMGKV